MGDVRIQGDSLFYGRGNFETLKREILEQIEKDIKSLGKKLLSMDEETLVQELEQKYRIEPIQLREEDIQKFSKDEEVYIDDPFFGRKKVNGTRIIIKIPFEGSAKVLYCTPRTSSTVFPIGKIVMEGGCQAIQLEYLVYLDDGTNLKKTHERNLKVLRDYITWINRDIEKFNRELPVEIRKLVEQRKNKLLLDEKLLDNLP